MTRAQVAVIVIQTVEELRNTMFVPNPATRGKTSTGNLAFNAIRYTLQDDVIDIFVDERIAPYVPYTNKPWTAKRWNRKKNPNEGWWERFCAEFARRLAVKLKGDLKND